MKKVLLYTLHKSASMFLHGLLRDLAKVYRLEHFSMNYEKMYEPIHGRSWNKYIDENNGLFGPIRIFEAEPNIPADLTNYSVILHTRDPRDILTSLYYSHTYSHKTWEGGFNPSDEKRKKWEEMGIDQYVLRNKNQKKKFQHLLTELWDQPGVIRVTYEEMVTDYASWLRKILLAFEHLPFPGKNLFPLISKELTPELLYSRLYTKYKDDFKIKKEDIKSHKRQVTPGDFRRKLKPETIDQLNQNYSEILHALNYSVD